MTVKTWKNEDGPIDSTFGYNDFLIKTDGRQIDDLLDSDRNLDENLLKNHSVENLTTEQASSIITKSKYRLRSGETYLQYTLPNTNRSVLILRKPVIDDLCAKGDVKENYGIEMSPNLAKAIAHYSGTGTGASWCRVAIQGEKSGPKPKFVTPWDLESKAGIYKLEDVVEKIKKAKSGQLDKNDPNYELKKNLISNITDEELKELSERIANAKKGAESVWERIAAEPKWKIVAGTAGIAAIFHYVGKGLGFFDSKVGTMMAAREAAKAVVGGAQVAISSTGKAMQTSGKALANGKYPLVQVIGELIEIGAILLEGNNSDPKTSTFQKVMDAVEKANRGKTLPGCVEFWCPGMNEG